MFIKNRMRRFVRFSALTCAGRASAARPVPRRHKVPEATHRLREERSGSRVCNVTIRRLGFCEELRWGGAEMRRPRRWRDNEGRRSGGDGARWFGGARPRDWFVGPEGDGWARSTLRTSPPDSKSAALGLWKVSAQPLFEPRFPRTGGDRAAIGGRRLSAGPQCRRCFWFRRCS